MSNKENMDLKEFEALLRAEKTKIEKNIEMILAEVSSIGTEEEIGDLEDMAELEIDNTTDQALLLQLKNQIAEIDAALGRIVQGTYGICEKTHKPIPVERLRAIPWARTVVGE
ncbi:TraR/DksA family transcriptional regulator [Sulfuricurvum sp.]|uniref:TraR/DksA family transcriptional regulator n=1 Tax=Sulfuricurvum sp. TaxID=2025608 RepID=UPI003BB15028